MAEKILIIGAGIGQLHLVDLAHQMGWHVTVVSPMGNYPALDTADAVFDCDIYDYDRIVDYARKEGFQAVASDQNDFAVPTVAYVAEHLGLPGNTYQQALTYCDKGLFRALCKKANVPAPQFELINENNEKTNASLCFPLIVKPTDSQSSKGIRKVNTQEELHSAIEYAKSWSRQKSVIVEEYFEGTEYVCEGFVYKGKYYHLAFGDRRYFQNTLIPAQTTFPAAALPQDVQNRIIACEERLSAATNAEFGILHSEYLVNTDGNICIVESALRGGGVYISSHLMPMATGIGINTLLLHCAMGVADQHEVDQAFKNHQHKAAAYVCFYLPVGTIHSIQGIEEAGQLPGVKFCDIRDMKVGDHTEPMVAKGQRKGPLLVEADSLEQLEQRVQAIQQTIRVTVLTPTGLQNAIWQ